MKLKLQLEAAGRPKLFDLLMEAVGTVVADRFEIERPLAVGSQSFVFLANDLLLRKRAVVKQPAFDYSRPLALGRADVAAARDRLRQEHELLVRSPTHHLPRPIALVTGDAAVRSARSSAVFGPFELFLIEEWIEGSTIAEQALSGERQAIRVARELILFSSHLLRAGWFYGDISAANVIVKPSGAVRVVDAGSAVQREDEITIRSFTPAFTTPVLHRRLIAGAKIPGRLSSILPLLAKVLHFGLTRSEPLDGQLPKLELLGGYSYACTRAIEAMLHLDGDPSALDRARTMLDEWGAWPELD